MFQEDKLNCECDLCGNTFKTIVLYFRIIFHFKSWTKLLPEDEDVEQDDEDVYQDTNEDNLDIFFKII